MMWAPGAVDDMDLDQNLDEALAPYVKRTRLSKAVLVASSDNKVAEKVEPGYLIKLAEDIEKANDFVLNSACGKLKLIEEQMKFLKNQALQILIDTKISSTLHSLPCNFPKKVGNTYSVYRKPTGEYYFSMLLPAEWGSTVPHEYIGSFQLKGNQSWSPMDSSSKDSAVHHWIRPQNEGFMMID